MASRSFKIKVGSFIVPIGNEMVVKSELLTDFFDAYQGQDTFTLPDLPFTDLSDMAKADIIADFNDAIEGVRFPFNENSHPDVIILYVRFADFFLFDDETISELILAGLDLIESPQMLFLAYEFPGETWHEPLTSLALNYNPRRPSLLNPTPEKLIEMLETTIEVSIIHLYIRGYIPKDVQIALDIWGGFYNRIDPTHHIISEGILVPYKLTGQENLNDLISRRYEDTDLYVMKLFFEHIIPVEDPVYLIGKGSTLAFALKDILDTTRIDLGGKTPNNGYAVVDIEKYIKLTGTDKYPNF